MVLTFVGLSNLIVDNRTVGLARLVQYGVNHFFIILVGLVSLQIAFTLELV